MSILNRVVATITGVLLCGAASAASGSSEPLRLEGRTLDWREIAVGQTFGPDWLTATGGVPPYVYTAVSGALPPGVTFEDWGPWWKNDPETHALVRGVPTQGGPFALQVQVRDALGAVAFASVSGDIYPVPEPVPLDIPYTLGCVYMPKPSYPSHQWADQRCLNEKNCTKLTQGQRLPLLGYYQGDSSEVLDWQIKFAIDRGITCFLFDDYWVEGVPEPVYDGPRQALLSARYGGWMSWAFLLNGYELADDSAEGKIAYFLGTVIPYYGAHANPRYLTIDDKPAIVILSTHTAFGTADPGRVAATLTQAEGILKSQYGYFWRNGVTWVVNGYPASRDASGAPVLDFGWVAEAGFDVVWPYYANPEVWPIADPTHYPIPLNDPSGDVACAPGLPYGAYVDAAIELNARAFDQAAKHGVRFVPSPTPDFDSRGVFWQQNHVYYQGQDADEYARLLASVRATVDAHPGSTARTGAAAKPVVGLGAWNEHMECASIEPSFSAFQAGAGPLAGDPFRLGNLAADAFGGPGGYSELIPGDHSRGFPENKVLWTFESEDDLALWQSLADAGLSLAKKGFMAVRTVRRAVLLTCCDTDVQVGRHERRTVRLRARFDPTARVLLSTITLSWMASTYSRAAHLFGAPPEPDGHFLTGLYPVTGIFDDAAHPADAAGFREYVFDFGHQPGFGVDDLWNGRILELELRFEGNGAAPMQIDIASLSLE